MTKKIFGAKSSMIEIMTGTAMLFYSPQTCTLQNVQLSKAFTEVVMKYSQNRDNYFN